MHKLQKMTAALLVAVLLCLSITSCHGSPSSSSDICQTVAGISADTVLLTIDGREVTAEEYLYWSSLVLDSYYHNHIYNTDADDKTCSWVGENWNGGPSATVLGYLMNYNEPILHAADLGFSIEEEELAAAVDQLVADTKSRYGGDDSFDLYLSQICISQEGFRHIMEENIYYQHLLEYLYNEEGEYAPSEEDILSFADDNGYYSCKYVFFSTVGCYTDEAVERVRSKAQSLLDILASSDDPDAYFSAAITDSNWNDDNEESQSGLVSILGAATISTGFDEAVNSLEAGEFSGIVDNTDEYGYFIIQRLPVRPEDVRDAYCAYSFNQLVSQWIADADVEYTDAYNQLNIQNFYVSLINYRLSTDVDADTES